MAGLTKQEGQSTHDYRYGAYGQLLPAKGNWTDPHDHYTFGGKEWEEHLGLYEFSYRLYDPQAGVWLTKDPLRGSVNRPRTLHRYQYAFASPISYYDAYGLQGEGPPGEPTPTNDPGKTLLERLSEGPPPPSGVRAPRCFDILNTLPETNLFMEPNAVISRILSHGQTVESYARLYGVPPELVAGILAAELDDDINREDVILDSVASACYSGLKWAPPFVLPTWACREVYESIGVGVGIGQIHINRPGLDWWAAVEHFEEEGYPLPDWADEPTRALLTDEGAVEGIALVSRALADVRTGSNASHESDLTSEDMAMIFVAYRYGVGEFTDLLGSHAFPNPSAFQARTPSELPDDAQLDFQIAEPYMEGFRCYFDR